MKKIIKKYFLTNPLAEYLLIKLANHMPFFKKVFPDNTHYPKYSMRSVIRGGLSFRLDISDYQEYLVYFNLDIDSSKGVIKYLSRGEGLILDIGANIGQTSLWMANELKLEEVEIIAVEPYPSTFQKLTYNINLNHFRNITPINIAFGNSDSKLLMEGCSSNSGAFRVNSNIKNGDFIEVSQTTLDNYFKDDKRHIKFIKIDVEGFEYNVIKGGEYTIKKYHPTLFIEIDNENLKSQNSTALDLLVLLKNYGYNSILKSDTLTEVQMNELDYCHFDVICQKI